MLLIQKHVSSKNHFTNCEIDRRRLRAMLIVRFTQGRFFGFQGNDEKWSEEFKKLCEEKKADPKKGIGWKRA